MRLPPNNYKDLPQYILWRCNECNTEVISDKHHRHTMDKCKCESPLYFDAEDFYWRIVGNEKNFEYIESFHKDKWSEL